MVIKNNKIMEKIAFAIAGLVVAIITYNKDEKNKK